MSGLPLVPAASCPSAASALASAGLGPICSAASAAGAAASGAVGQAASSVVGFGANTVLDAIGSWVSSGAVWLLGQIGAVLGATTSIDLGASWFTAHYETMAALAGVVVLPLLLLGILQSVYRQSASMLVRSVLLNVPLAILLTAIAVKLVQIGLSVTDSMSAAVAHGAGLDTGNFMASVVTDLDSGSGSGTPAFVLFLGGIVVVIGAVLVWIELLIRSAAVYVAVLFLPLALASLAWPAIAHWCRRLVDTLAALVLGKFVIVSVLSLAAGALAGGSAAGGGGDGRWRWRGWVRRGVGRRRVVAARSVRTVGLVPVDPVHGGRRSRSSGGARSPGWAPGGRTGPGSRAGRDAHGRCALDGDGGIGRVGVAGLRRCCERGHVVHSVLAAGRGVFRGGARSRHHVATGSRHSLVGAPPGPFSGRRPDPRDVPAGRHWATTGSFAGRRGRG